MLADRVLQHEIALHSQKVLEEKCCITSELKRTGYILPIIKKS